MSWAGDAGSSSRTSHTAHGMAWHGKAWSGVPTTPQRLLRGGSGGGAVSLCVDCKPVARRYL
jgi:hypothetical protein